MINVIIVDVKGIITQLDYDVIARHDAYGAALKMLEPNSMVYVLSRHEVKDNGVSDNIKIISTKSIIKFFKRGSQLMRSLEGGILLVSGDPWESFFSCFVLRKASQKQAPIQLQLHADVGSPIWKGLNWRNRIRSVILPFSLRHAEQIRCVSSAQLANLEKIMSLENAKTVVIPVPIKIDDNWIDKRKSQENCSIALVGRIHKDRGLEEFIRVCKILSYRYFSLSIIVVGDGPHKKWLQKTLKNEGLIRYSSFLGNLNQRDLSLIWQTFGCVASFAPSESYGRSARESLIYGVPVLAKRSSGLEELGQILDRNGIWFLDGLSDDQIIKVFSLVSGFIVDEKVSKLIIKDVNSMNEEIANSWITGSTLPILPKGRKKRLVS
jgi:glycosyltransferase involved in cell wall biosynthesis